MLEDSKVVIKNLLNHIKVTNFLNLLVYLLPLSLIRFQNLTFIKLPFAYLIFSFMFLSLISDFKEIKFKFNKILLILFSLSISLMTISYLINNNYSYSSYLGITIRLLVIIISTNLLIDIKSLYRNLITSIPLYLIPSFFTEKINILNLNDFAVVNSNVLGSSLISIVLLIFVIKRRFGFKISFINYISVIFSSIFILISTESRGVLLSIFLCILILNSWQFLKKLFQEFKVSKSSLKIYSSLFLTFFILIFSILTINPASEQFLSRYYFLTENSLENATLGLATSDLKRYYLGTSALKNISKKPIFGHGSGNSQEVFRTIELYDRFNQKRKSLHNTYLTISYDFGIPCLIILILFCRQAVLMNFEGYGNFNLLIIFNLIYGFFNDSFAKNYFIFVLTILCIGYFYQKKSKI
jgi:hypothetical protein